MEKEIMKAERQMKGNVWGSNGSSSWWL